MLKCFFCLFLLFSQVSFFGQKKEIEILDTRTNESVIISIKNNTKDTKEITLTVKGTGFSKIDSPITKTLDANGLIVFCELKPIKNKAMSYNLSYTYISKINTKEPDKLVTAKTENNSIRTITNENPSKITNTTTEDLSKGIFVFAKDGCSRCGMTIKFLEENNIKHKVFHISKNKESNELMWAKLVAINFSGKITMPVLLINNKLSHSHKDLSSFLKKLSD